MERCSQCGGLWGRGDDTSRADRKDCLLAFLPVLMQLGWEPDLAIKIALEWTTRTMAKLEGM